jgi:crossover junction endodeoxyribonuclease RuvC
LRVLGIDPGSQKIGLAVVEGDARTVRPVAFATRRLPAGAIGGRLQALYREVGEWIERWQPEAAAMEEVFVARNPRSALMLGQARGAALLALADGGLHPHGFAAASIKLAVAGHGRAGKPEMRRAVRMQLHLDRDPPEDAADALAVALTLVVTAWTARLEVGA